MQRVRWVAMGFEKGGDRLVGQVELPGLRSEEVAQLLGVPVVDVIGVSIDVDARVAAAIAPYAERSLDFAAADWQIEARAARRR